MALIDVVKWEVSQREFCHKFPSDDLRIGSQLVVYPVQTAFFVKGGRVLDEFQSGTHTLTSENLPLLNKLINLPFGSNSPFQAEVWYVNQITKLDLKWGTPTPIQLEDPKYSIIVPEDDASFTKLKEAKATLARLNVAGRDVYQMERSFDVGFTSAMISITTLLLFLLRVIPMKVGFVIGLGFLFLFLGAVECILGLPPNRKSPTAVLSSPPSSFSPSKQAC